MNYLIRIIAITFLFSPLNLYAQSNSEDFSIYKELRPLKITFFINYSTIRASRKYVYWEEYQNKEKYDQTTKGINYKSEYVYFRGDCELFRYSYLKLKYYKHQDLNKLVDSWTVSDDKKEKWYIANPGHRKHEILATVCARAGM